MKRSSRDERAFAQLRQIPTELSREEVQQMIKLLPTLPPPKTAWFSSFSLNSILMSTIFLSVLSLLTYFNFTNSPTPTPTHTLTTWVKTAHAQVNQSFENRLQNADNQQIVLGKVDSIIIEEPAALTDDLFTTATAPLVITPPILPSKQPELFTTPTAPVELMQVVKPSRLVSESNWGKIACELQIKFDGNPRLFKGKLLREMLRDGFITNKKEKMRCYFSPHGMIVNEQLLAADQQKKYEQLFAAHHIYPCERRVIEATDDYLAVGDIANDGFHGMMNGRVNINHLDTITLSTLLPMPELEEPSSLFSDFGLIWSDLVCEEGVVFNNFSYQQAKKVFLSELVADGLLPNMNAELLCYFTPRGIVINEQFLEAEKSQKYYDILARKGIEPCSQRVIYFPGRGNDFAVGDMTSHGFEGFMQGAKKLEKVNDIPPHPALHNPDLYRIKRPIGSFHTLKVSGLAQVYLTERNYDEVRLELTNIDEKDVITNYENGVLNITTRGQHNGETIRIFTSSDDLVNIEVSGAGELYSHYKKIKGEEVKIKVAEVGAAWLDVEVNDLEITMAGGDLNIDGTAKTRRLIDNDPEKRGTLREADLYVENRLTDAASTNTCFEMLTVERDQLQQLKNELGDLLAQNKANLSNLDFPVRIHFFEQQFLVNGQALTNQQAGLFTEVLERYHIMPCEDRLITVGRKFIAAGDIREEGFRGTILGKKMQLQSRYGKIKISVKDSYKTLTASWGTEVHLNN